MKSKKEQILLLANDLMFELSNTDTINIENEFNSIQEQLNNISEINTHDIQPTSFCIEFENIELREDVEVTNDQDVLGNCKFYDGKFVVIKDEK